MNRFPSYDVTETETHHVHKLDAPSGTAITLAEQICREMDRKTDWVKGRVVNADGTVTEAETAAPDRLRIDAVRHNRHGFALGAVLAAEFTATHSGLLTTDDLFAF